MAMLNNQRVYTYMGGSCDSSRKTIQWDKEWSFFESTSGHIVPPAEEWLSSHRLQAAWGSILTGCFSLDLDNEIPNSFTTNRSVC